MSSADGGGCRGIKPSFKPSYSCIDRSQQPERQQGKEQRLASSQRQQLVADLRNQMQKWSQCIVKQSQSFAEHASHTSLQSSCCSGSRSRAVVAETSVPKRSRSNQMLMMMCSYMYTYRWRRRLSTDLSIRRWHMQCITWEREKCLSVNACSLTAPSDSLRALSRLWFGLKYLFASDLFVRLIKIN